MSDESNSDFIDGLDLNRLKNLNDLHWLRMRRNQILHYEGPVEGFWGNSKSDNILKTDAARADFIIQKYLKEISIITQQAKKIFHFRVLVDYLVNPNYSSIELEKTYNYKFLASPVFYKKLNEIQSIISSQIKKNQVIEADSNAFDSLAPIQ